MLPIRPTTQFKKDLKERPDKDIISKGSASPGNSGYAQAPAGGL